MEWSFIQEKKWQDLENSIRQEQESGVGDDVALFDRIPFLDAELDDTAGDFGVDVGFLGIGPAP